MAQAKPPAVQETEEEVLDRKVFECLCALLDVEMLTREFARFMEDIGELPAASNLPTTVHHPDDETEFPKVGCIALADWSTDEIAAQIQLQWSSWDRAIGKAIIAVDRIRAFIDDKDQPPPDRFSARIIAELQTFTVEHSHDDRGRSCILLDRDWVGELRQLDRYIARQRIKITSMEWPDGGAEDEATTDQRPRGLANNKSANNHLVANSAATLEAVEFEPVDEAELLILQYLAGRSRGFLKESANEIADGSKLNRALVQARLERLQETGYVKQSGESKRDSKWALLARGRAFILHTADANTAQD